MMGKSHLLLGSAGFLAVGAPVLHALGTSLDPAQLAAGTVVCAGASMLPDLDHPQATVSHSLGPVTEHLSHLVAKLSGGHRHGTHSILFALLVTFGLRAAFAATSGPWLALGICFFFASLVVKVLTESRGVIAAIISAIIACTLVALAPGQDWIPWVVGLGCLLHDFGDVLTPESVPPFWPLSGRKISLHVIGHSGDRREWAIGIACTVAICLLGWSKIYAPIYQHERTATPAVVHQQSVVRTTRLRHHVHRAHH
jgi:membrane-bound metal-dependent hydrolase YbcI (DUF457 family)